MKAKYYVKNDGVINGHHHHIVYPVSIDKNALIINFGYSEKTAEEILEKYKAFFACNCRLLIGITKDEEIKEIIKLQ